jgi:hypothetical protein
MIVLFCRRLVFRVVLVVLGMAATWGLWRVSENGRYSFQRSSDARFAQVMDTRTGNVRIYMLSVPGREWIILDAATGKVERRRVSTPGPESLTEDWR